MTIKTVEMDFTFMNYIPGPPVSTDQLYGAATSNDAITIKSWRDVWIKNVEANHKTHGPFINSHIGMLYGSNALKPAIVVGSGPSLKGNVEDLKEAKDIPIISCLHNFHFLTDKGIKPAYYVSLDAGEVTLEEIAEGGEHEIEYYLEKSKEHTLVAFIGSSPKLINSWKGKILWFNAPIPDVQITEAIEKIEKFQMFLGSGGNVLGAATYFAKGVLGSNPIAFVGADFSFSYVNKFHGWDSKYDKSLGNVMRAVDIFGNKVHTWRSYYNFKSWFDFICVKVPGIWVNCTEGGCLGAYNEGNIQQITQMELKHFIGQYYIHEKIEHQCKNPADGRDPKAGLVQILF